MNFDNEFLNRIKIILGDEYDDFISSLSNEKITSLRINSLKRNTDGNKDARTVLSDDGTRFTTDIKWEPYGYIYTEGYPGKHPLHEAGAYYIQEPSAMSPVHYLAPAPGEKILDLCAAPGGKSTQIASYMKGEGILVSNEIDKKRAQILSLNMERCAVANALVTNMEPGKLSEIFEGYFDKILVDAPCSGEGMFRKNDEAIENWSTENVSLCSKRQTDILKDAVKMLAPGGRLVYSTCTFAPEEDEYQAAKLLSMGLKPVKVDLFEDMVSGDIENLKKVLLNCENLIEDKEFVDNLPQYISDDIKICSGRLWPHKVKGEGHFFAVFEKEGEITKGTKLYGINGRIREAGKAELKLFSEFADGFLSDKGKKLKGTPFMMGDQLYLAPEGMPGIGGITVMRPGLHLGTVKNNRFEPSHSLALTLSKEDVNYSYELVDDADNDDKEKNSRKAMEFIGGMSFRIPDLTKGWYLMTAYGYSLGWAKYAGGVLKNHYPKGLRIYT
ncbi:RsmF rRNA methyltransferase first C-terminal domain-containing protein [Butyrivibrio sp. JL13D10]|uniref:RsmF rRNA methyltransferase first C-terminal domain-containing protein n=1 Tax=Butyrivibrio sp. JL13D10 TaxID=3236815 RepID=UPI0038B4E712